MLHCIFLLMQDMLTACADAMKTVLLEVITRWRNVEQLKNDAFEKQQLSERQILDLEKDNTEQRGKQSESQTFYWLSRVDPGHVFLHESQVRVPKKSSRV